ncbi:MAG: hypothetical protein ACKO9B_09015 [Planctomycetota bacterium]
MRVVEWLAGGLVVAGIVALTTAMADEPATAAKGATKAAAKPAPVKPTRIIPLVVVAPGETKTVLFSCECPVGVTRGGGLELSAMTSGEGTAPVGTTSADGDTFRHAGVTVSVPDDEEASRLDKKLRSRALVALAKRRPVVPVTVSAEPGTAPVAIDLHLVDATCSGHCHTDFTVVVEAPVEAGQ